MPYESYFGRSRARWIWLAGIAAAQAIGLFSKESAAISDTYDLELSAEGKELSRAKLDTATAQFARIATGAWANGSAQVPGFGRLAPTLSEYQAETAKSAPRPAGVAGGRGNCPRPGPAAEQWNALQIIVDTDMVWVSLNGRQAAPNSATRDHMMGYGLIALHVAGSSEVKFRDVSFLDDDLIARLKRRAARHGRSAEAEQREILRQALAGEEEPIFEKLAAETA